MTPVQFFDHVVGLSGPSWRVWRTVLAAAYGLADEVDPAVWQRIAGGRPIPTEPCREVWALAGRRGGKSRIASLVAVYEAAFRDFEDRLAPGERATVMLIAADRKQARVLLRYVKGLVASVPTLAALVRGETQESLDIGNAIIEVHSASFRSTRGYTAAAVICDEVASWWDSDDSANPADEVLNALRPSLATLDGAIWCITNPHARRGVVYEAHRDFYGKAEDVLVVEGDSRTFNPSLPARVVERAFDKDPAKAWSEFGRDSEIRFREDVELFVTHEMVEAVTDPGVTERAPGRRAVAFIDPSSGAGTDSMALAVASWQGDVAVLELAREVRPPFDAREVVRDFAAVLKSRGLTRATADSYAHGIVAAMFKAEGITLDPAPFNASQLYLRLLPGITSKTVRLLDSERLRAQFVALERRATANGERVDYPRGAAGHGDLANAAAGALVLAGERRPTGDHGVTISTGNDSIGTGRERRPSCDGFSYAIPAHYVDLGDGMWGPPSLLDESKGDRA